MASLGDAIKELQTIGKMSKYKNANPTVVKGLVGSCSVKMTNVVNRDSAAACRVEETLESIGLADEHEQTIRKACDTRTQVSDVVSYIDLSLIHI